MLVNLLQHEVVVPALFQRGNLQFNGLDFRGDFSVADGADGQFAVPRHRGDFLIFQVDHIFGVRHNGCGVRPHKEVVVAPHADHERACLAGGHQAVWMGFVEHHNGVCAHHLLEGDTHGVRKVKACGVHDLFDEMRQHFGVGVADEGVPSVGEQLFERFVILNDAVVNHRDFALAPHVRVGIAVTWGAVGGPAGVPDSDGAHRDVFGNVGLEVGDLAFLFFYTKFSLPL